MRTWFVRGARPTASSLLLLVSLFLLPVPPVYAYSVLSHEAVVDMAWKDSIEPLLKARFPQATDDDLNHAHAFAYGGSVIQDIGYYPHGEKFASDLLHYVRSGDFIRAMVNESSDLDEYAFALGALAHYSSDTNGHPAVNEATA
ncbi:MAG TPA: zinc dependent phospholipase C family protein, partial [Acidobacteriaceae bacterium]|nr:zinc dependent phospholipase C family protein [Acidobacteriaceae bacterium]